jgi:preprotein translocase subunit SecG
MFSFLMAIEVLVSILLMLVVLMQSSKGGGLAGTFGGGQMGMVFGVRRTADFLTRATQILAASFIVLSLVINIFFLPRPTESTESVIPRGSAQQGTVQPTLPPETIPPQEAPQMAPGSPATTPSAPATGGGK